MQIQGYGGFPSFVSAEKLTHNDAPIAAEALGRNCPIDDRYWERV